MNILKRAKYLALNGISIYTTDSFRAFLYEKAKINPLFFKQKNLIKQFCLLDDYDVLICIKHWADGKDKVLKLLSNTLINRNLLKIKSVNKNDIQKNLKQLRNIAVTKFNIGEEEVKYLVFSISIKNETYNFIDNEIKFLQKNGVLINPSDIKKEFSINTENSKIIKHYICYPKDCSK